jgi:maltose phosphorylase
MAAAWMSLVYGFGGMRSDGERLSFWPVIPAEWNGYSFRIVYRGALLELRVTKQTALFKVLEGPAVEIDIYSQKQTVGGEGLSLALCPRKSA